MGKSDLRVFIGADASNFNKNIKAAQGQLVKFENVAKSVGSSIKTALVGAFAIDSAQRFFSTMIEAGRGFEDQMARVKAISNASAKNFEMMRKEAARLGETTKYSASQAAAALENLVRNGLSATKATKALSSVLELAGANAIELAEAADIVTNTMNMFEISIDDLNRVNDVLSSTTAKSATNLTDLYEALTYSAPTANLFGIQIEEVNAALGILANQGIKGSQAGTTLRNVLNSLVKPSRMAKDILANLGIDEVSIKLDGLLGTLERLKGLKIEDFVRVFGKEFGGITKALVDSGDLTAALKDSLNNSSGEAARMFNQGAGSFNVAIDSFKSAFEGAMIKMFDSAKPALTAIINGFTEIIKTLQDIPSVAAGATVAIGGAIGKIFQDTRKNALAEWRADAKAYIRDKWAIEEANAKEISDVTAHNARLEQLRQQRLEIINKLYQYQTRINALSTTSPTGGFNPEMKNVLTEFKSFINGLNKKDFGFIQEAFKNLDISKLEKAHSLLSQMAQLGMDDTLDENSAEFQKRYESLANQLKALGGVGGLRTSNITEQISKIHAELEKLIDIEPQLKKMPDPKTIPTFNSRLWNNAVNGVKKAVSGFINLLGGPWVVGLTAAATAATAVWRNLRKIGESAREVKESMKEALSESTRLSSSFRKTVDELSKLNKGSIAWESRMKWLTQNYPELTNELRLNELSVNTSADAYTKLASAMDKVINRQNKINLSEAATAARDKLIKTYVDNDFGWFANTQLSQVKKYLSRQYKSSGDEIYINSYLEKLMEVLTSNVEEAVKKSRLVDVFKEINKEFPKVQFNPESYAHALYNDFMNRVGNDIETLTPYLNHDTYKGLQELDIVEFVERAMARLEAGKKDIKIDADVRYPEGGDEKAKYIAEETQRFAMQLFDEVLNKFKGQSIGKIDAREFLMEMPLFQQLIQAAKSKPDDIGTANPDAEAVFGEELEEAKKEYIKELYAIAEEYHRGYIDEEEFQKKKLDALNSLINVYRQHGDILGKEYALYQANLFELNKVIKDRTDAEKRKKERDEKQYQIDIDRRDAGRDFKSIMNSPFEMETLFDNTQLLEARLGHLKGQLEDLKSLRTSIADMDGLADMTKELDSAIAKLTTHVGELAEKFRQVQIDDFKKQVKDMRKDLDIASYDTFVGFNQGIVSIVDACRTLDKLGEGDMDGWERFVTGFQAVISITDTLVSTAESIRSFGKMLEEFGKAKEVLSGAESGANLMDVAAIEAEAGAVVAAEATKIGAIESKAAANIAAKLAEIKAAEALMAAESAAAYAGIPFAGVGLAAAQIAELKALIAASAAFANGGIVGGTSTVGDRVLARVNSGEMILNKRQQGNLFSLLNSGSTGGGTSKVEFKLKGSELVGVLNNYNGKMNKLR